MSGRATIYLDYLSHEGYNPYSDSDGDVVFKYEGGLYYVAIDVTDESYFQLVYPTFWSIENENEAVNAFLAAVTATRKTKVAKVYVLSNHENVSASVELLLDRPEDFKYVFDRAIRTLRAAVRNFVEEMNKLRN